MTPEKSSKRPTISEQLKSAISEYGDTPYALAKASGVSQAALSRFINGERGLTLDSVEKLCEVLGLELQPAGQVKAPKAPRPAKRVLPVDLVALMQQIEPGALRGALVGARDLRRAAEMPKEKFDAEALRLAKAGTLSLHRHDYPASMTPAERDELVTDGRGTFYVGMALRQN